jgi:putative transposase
VHSLPGTEPDAHLLTGGESGSTSVFREQAAAVAGPKGQHQAGRTHHHWGTTPTELTLGGRRIQVPRPRVRGREGGEVTLPAVAAFRGREPLTARVLEQILLGVSTRGYAASLEAGPVGVPSRGTSRSAASRTLIRRTREQVAAQLSRRLDGLDLVALFGDGVVVAGQTVIVRLGITRDGRKEPLGVRKLPRQVDTSKLDSAGALGLGRNTSGGTWPRLSWGRSVL